jgi:hypothetical protein
MTKPKILLTLIFLLSSCASNQKDRVKEQQLSCNNLRSLYENPVTKHLRLSLDDYAKYGDMEEFEFPKIEELFTDSQLELTKEKFLMLKITEKSALPYNPEYPDESYKKQIANQYVYTDLVILISPEKMRVWKLELYPSEIFGVDIYKVEEIRLSSKKRKELEACKAPENMPYWR